MNEGYKSEVDQHSSEWSQITTQLQFSTGQPSIKLINLFRYNISMERSSKDTSLDSFIDITDLKSQFKANVIEKTIPLQDLIFICGHFNVEKYKLQPSKVFKFLLCQVVLGKIAPFSQGFKNADSLLIEPDNISDPYHYDLLVKDYAQYEVKYQLSFILEDDSQIKQTPIVCSLCAQKIATIYCIDEKKHYCEKCSSYVHPEKHRSYETHPKHSLQKVTRTNSLPLCQSHAERHEFYCPTCTKYLCQECIKQNLHNKNKEHPYRPLQYHYSEKHQSNARLPIKPKQKLNQLLSVAQQRLKQIVDNYQQVKKSLEQKVRLAYQQLETLYKRKLVRVQNDLIQIELQLEKIDWFTQFVKKHEEILKPTYYFKIQARFEYQINRIKMNRFGSSYDVYPDLDHFCIIEVDIQPAIKEIRQKYEGKSLNMNSSRKNQTHLSFQNEFAKSKLLKFNPNSDPIKLGDLSLQLQNSGISFFRSKYRIRQLGIKNNDLFC